MAHHSEARSPSDHFIIHVTHGRCLIGYRIDTRILQNSEKSLYIIDGRRLFSIVPSAEGYPDQIYKTVVIVIFMGMSRACLYYIYISLANNTKQCCVYHLQLRVNHFHTRVNGKDKKYAL
jgi:hypothetical protein